MSYRARSNFNNRSRGRGSGRGFRGGYQQQRYPAEDEREYQQPTQSYKPRFKPRNVPIQPDEPTRQPKVEKIEKKEESKEVRKPDLTPKHLSTTFTEPKNDPSIMKESMLDGLNGFRFRSKKLSFAVDCAGFKPLVTHSYNILCSKDSRFKKAVSLASYCYYCDLALWRRFLFLLHAHGDDSDTVFIQLDKKLGPMPLPKVIYQYLACIGDLTDANQRNWRVLIPLPNEYGHFGEMNDDNFVKYMAYPTPAISIASVIKEVAAFVHIDQVMQPWGIDGVIPDGFNFFSDNVNGYHLPNKLTSQQYRELINIGIDEEGLPSVSIGGIDVCQDLVNYVRDYVLNLTVMEIIKEHPENREGSIVQMSFIKRIGNAPAVEDVTKFTCITKGPIESQCSHQLNSQSACTSLMYRLRFDRRRRNDGYPVLPVPGDEPFPDWENFDDIYSFGNCNRWNIGDFVLGDVDGEEVLEEFLQNFIIVK